LIMLPNKLCSFEQVNCSFVACQPIIIFTGLLASTFYRAACNADAVLWCEFCLSVCPSVCLSVTRVDC